MHDLGQVNLSGSVFSSVKLEKYYYIMYGGLYVLNVECLQHYQSHYTYSIKALALIIVVVLSLYCYLSRIYGKCTNVQTEIEKNIRSGTVICLSQQSKNLSFYTYVERSA